MAGIDSNVKLMLHMNGSDGSPTFIDDSESAHSPVRIGDAQIDTAQSKFGGASGLFDGTGDNVEVPDSPDWDFGTNDLAMDCWVRFNSVSGNQCFVGRPTSGSSYFYWALEGGGIRFRDFPSGFDVNFGAVFSFSTSVWYHLAITRSGNDFRFFVDGVQKGSTIVNSGSFMVRSIPLEVGSNSAIGYYVNGWMDEVRISNGDSRWTSNFTPPTSEYTSDTITITETEDFTLADDYNLIVDTRLEDNFTVDDSIIVKLAKSAIIADTFTVADEISMESLVNHEATFNLQDEISVFIPVEYINLEETFTLNDIVSANLDQTAKYASRIISVNPLIMITDTDPVEVVKIDITDPANPTHITYTINEVGETVKNAKDIVYNSVFDLFYIVCADGQILEIDGSDFTVRTQHDTGDTDDLLQIASLDDYHNIYAGTEDTEGEVIMMKKFEAESLGLDIRFLEKIETSIGLQIDSISAKSLSMDIRFLAETTQSLGLDIRFHSQVNNPFPNIIPAPNPDPNSPTPTAGAPIEPIKREDFHVHLNGSETDDVKLDSIIIYHYIDNDSKAVFNLNRKHDQLNNKLDGTPSAITSQNAVKIYIRNNLEFEGNIHLIDCESNDEIVQVTAVGSSKTENRKAIILSLPSIDEPLHIYHALVHNPSINDPVIDPDDENPEFFKGIKVDLGEDITQSILRQTFFDSSQETIGGNRAEKIMNGTFQPLQNWQYFWGSINATNFITGRDLTANYVGTSLAGYTSDLWVLNFASFKRQRIFDNIVTGKIDIDNPSPGTVVQTQQDDSSYVSEYRVGEAPFRDISTRNGRLTTKDKWVDKPDGLYRERDAGYNFVNYAKAVADIEYEKLKNINGDIAPITEATMDLFIDGYYYHGISLLTRINIDNTTTSSIWKNNNGFPVSVKAIQINSSTMKISLTCDNLLSDIEILEIEEDFPDEESDEYNFEAELALQFSKYDPNRNEFPQ